MESGDTPPTRPFEPSDLVGDLFADRYRLLRLVSTGANTAIYDASDEQSGRTVTLKVIRPKLAASPTFRSRFDESMRAVSAMSHPNIAALFDWGIARVGDTSTAYVVNEYLSGGSLRDMFDRGRRLSPSQALAIGLDVCRGLDYAHRRKFVHTELNPSKIVFGDDRRLRIIDFGLARLLAAPTWKQPDSVPTHVAWYAAPEQGLGQPLDGRADVYALCLSLHEAVTGTLPFKSDSTVAALSARVGRLMPVSADLGPLAAVFERAGRPDADERATAAEFGQGLLQAASKLPRPEPLPLLSTSLFDIPIEAMRTPDDPTGGVVRSGAAPLLVVPADEPDTEDEAAENADAAENAEPDDTDEAAVVAGEQSCDASDAGVDEPADEFVILPLDAEVSPKVSAGEAHDDYDRPDDADDDDDDGDDDADDTGIVSAGAGRSTTVLPVTVFDSEVDEPARRRRGVPWKSLLAVLVVAALAALGVLATRLFRTPTEPVPELVGMPEAEALNLVAPNGWLVEVQSERSEAVPVAGQVVRTAPGEGVELAEGEPFLIVVSEGPTLRPLPESTGLTRAEAETGLAALGLSSDVTTTFDEVVPAGTVMSWSVPGDATLGVGSEVLPDTLVELVVSDGPAPRVVPHLIGRDVDEVRAELEAMGLLLAEVEPQFSDEFPAGAVMTQDTPEGAEVARGATVTVLTSKGEDLVVFPDLSAAASFVDADAILRASGFEPVLTFGDALGAITSIVIDGADPVVGGSYRRNTVVEIAAIGAPVVTTVPQPP